MCAEQKSNCGAAACTGNCKQPAWLQAVGDADLVIRNQHSKPFFKLTADAPPADSVQVAVKEPGL